MTCLRSFQSVALLAVLLYPGAANADEPVFLPGANWGLVPPPGFVVEEQPQAAFVHPAGAMIEVFTSSQPLDPSRFAATGTVIGQPGNRGRVQATQGIEVDGLPAHLMRIRMLEAGADVIGLVVQGSTTGSLTATIFDRARPVVTDDAVMAALMTAVERNQTPAKQLAARPIEFSNVSDLRIVVATPNGVVFTDGPENEGRLGPTQHFVSVVAFTAEAADGYRLARDLDAFANHLESSIRTLRVTGSRVAEGTNGRHMEVDFQVNQHDVPRNGTAWAFVTGQIMVMMVVQYPSGEEAATAERWILLRDGVSQR